MDQSNPIFKLKTCNAKTRAGTPCESQELGRGGRCRLHGGMSTGPKTLEGRRRSALNIGKDYDQLLAEKVRWQLSQDNLRAWAAKSNQKTD